MGSCLVWTSHCETSLAGLDFDMEETTVVTSQENQLSQGVSQTPLVRRVS